MAIRHIQVSECHKHVHVALVASAGGAGGGLGYESKPTFSLISGSNTPRLVRVLSDENNNGNKSLYLHNGVTLEFISTIYP